MVSAVCTDEFELVPDTATAFTVIAAPPAANVLDEGLLVLIKETGEISAVVVEAAGPSARKAEGAAVDDAVDTTNPRVVVGARL